MDLADGHVDFLPFVSPCPFYSSLRVSSRLHVVLMYEVSLRGSRSLPQKGGAMQMGTFVSKLMLQARPGESQTGQRAG